MRLIWSLKLGSSPLESSPGSPKSFLKPHSFVCDENVWNSIQNEIKSGTEFYWPGTEDKAYYNEKVTQIIVQVCCT